MGTILITPISFSCSIVQVHTSDLPLKFNMTKCMSIALAMTIISALGSLLLLVSISAEF